MPLRSYSKATHAVRYFLLRRLPPCQNMVTVMSESLERPLTVRERVELKLHLWVCAWCVWYLEHLRLMRDTLRLRATDATDANSDFAASLSAEARERIKLALKRPRQ